MSGYFVRALLLGDAMDTCGWSAIWHVHHSERAVACRHKLFLSLHVRNKGTCGRQPTSAQMIMRNLSTNVATVRCLRPRLEELELPYSFLFESFFSETRVEVVFWLLVFRRHEPGNQLIFIRIPTIHTKPRVSNWKLLFFGF